MFDSACPLPQVALVVCIIDRQHVQHPAPLPPPGPQVPGAPIPPAAQPSPNRGDLPRI